MNETTTVPDISIVVPCFNEEEVLPELFERLNSTAETWDQSFEVIAIDDGSRDDTWILLNHFAEVDDRWKAVMLSRNYGHQSAVSAGLQYASGRAVVIMDADLQDPPETVSRFIDQWQSGYHVVYGIRRGRKEGVLKRTCYDLFYRVLSALSSIDMPRDSGDFSLIDRRVVDSLLALPETNRFVRGLRAWVGYRQVGVEYERAVRAAGKPKYDFRQLLKLGLDGIFSFSTVPLRLLTYTGLWVSLLTFLGALVYLARRFTTETPVEGFATLIVAVLFLGGLQLVGLGIVGEYIGRIFDEVKRRPSWLVQSTRGLKREQSRSPVIWQGTDETRSSL